MLLHIYFQSSNNFYSSPHGSVFTIDDNAGKIVDEKPSNTLCPSGKSYTVILKQSCVRRNNWFILKWSGHSRCDYHEDIDALSLLQKKFRRTKGRLVTVL